MQHTIPTVIIDLNSGRKYEGFVLKDPMISQYTDKYLVESIISECNTLEPITNQLRQAQSHSPEESKNILKLYNETIASIKLLIENCQSTINGSTFTSLTTVDQQGYLLYYIKLKIYLSVLINLNIPGIKKPQYALSVEALQNIDQFIDLLAINDFTSKFKVSVYNWFAICRHEFAMSAEIELKTELEENINIAESILLKLGADRCSYSDLILGDIYEYRSHFLLAFYCYLSSLFRGENTLNILPTLFFTNNNESRLITALPSSFHKKSNEVKALVLHRTTNQTDIAEKLTELMKILGEEIEKNYPEKNDDLKIQLLEAIQEAIKNFDQELFRFKFVGFVAVFNEIIAKIDKINQEKTISLLTEKIGKEVFDRYSQKIKTKPTTDKEKELVGCAYYHLGMSAYELVTAENNQPTLYSLAVKYMMHAIFYQIDLVELPDSRAYFDIAQSYFVKGTQACHPSLNRLERALQQKKNTSSLSIALTYCWKAFLSGKLKGLERLIKYYTQLNQPEIVKKLTVIQLALQEKKPINEALYQQLKSVIDETDEKYPKFYANIQFNLAKFLAEQPFNQMQNAGLLTLAKNHLKQLLKTYQANMNDSKTLPLKEIYKETLDKIKVQLTNVKNALLIHEKNPVNKSVPPVSQAQTAPKKKRHRHKKKTNNAENTASPPPLIPSETYTQPIERGAINTRQRLPFTKSQVYAPENHRSIFWHKKSESRLSLEQARHAKTTDDLPDFQTGFSKKM